MNCLKYVRIMRFFSWTKEKLKFYMRKTRRLQPAIRRHVCFVAHQLFNLFVFLFPVSCVPNCNTHICWFAHHKSFFCCHLPSAVFQKQHCFRAFFFFFTSCVYSALLSVHLLAGTLKASKHLSFRFSRCSLKDQSSKDSLCRINQSSSFAVHKATF